MTDEQNTDATAWNEISTSRDPNKHEHRGVEREGTGEEETVDDKLKSPSPSDASEHRKMSPQEFWDMQNAKQSVPNANENQKSSRRNEAEGKKKVDSAQGRENERQPTPLQLPTMVSPTRVDHKKRAALEEDEKEKLRLSPRKQTSSSTTLGPELYIASQGKKSTDEGMESLQPPQRAQLAPKGGTGTASSEEFWSMQNAKQSVPNAKHEGDPSDEKKQKLPQEFWNMQQAKQAIPGASYPADALEEKKGGLPYVADKFVCGDADNEVSHNQVIDENCDEETKEEVRATLLFEDVPSPVGIFAIPGPGYRQQEHEERSLVDDDAEEKMDEGQAGNDITVLEATKVVELPEVEAVPLQNTGICSCAPRRRRMYIAVVLFLVVVIVAVLLGVLLSRGDVDVDAETVALVEANAFDGGVALQNTSSPQAMALTWLRRNSNLKQYSDAQKLQRYALATLYYSTNGEQWTKKAGWLTNNHECQWLVDVSSDKTICSDGENVRNLDLNPGQLVQGNNLTGTLPPEIALLSNSLDRVIIIGERFLTGSIPTSVGRLTKLRELLLLSNRLHGPIPSEMGKVIAIRDLRLNNNTLTGTVPSELNQLPKLDNLRLYHNNLSPPFECDFAISRCVVSCSNESDTACRIL